MLREAHEIAQIELKLCHKTLRPFHLTLSLCPHILPVPHNTQALSQGLVLNWIAQRDF